MFKNQLNKASGADDYDRLGKIRSNKNNSLCSLDWIVFETFLLTFQHCELIWSWQLVQVLGGFHLSDWPEPLVVMTRRQTPLRDFAAVQTSIDELTSDIRPFRGIYEGTECCVHHPWNCKTKACNCYWHAWGEPTIRHNSANFALDRILNRERDFRFFSGNLTLGHSRIGMTFKFLTCIFTVSRTWCVQMLVDLTPWL